MKDNYLKRMSRIIATLVMIPNSSVFFNRMRRLTFYSKMARGILEGLRMGYLMAKGRNTWPAGNNIEDDFNLE
jgi:hypothetical protein